MLDKIGEGNMFYSWLSSVNVVLFGISFHICPLRLRLEVHKGMELNDHRGMERYGMEWNGIK